MYEQYFGLRKNPFVMAPDPAFLFLTAAHREALAGLTYAVLSRKGFLVLTGEAGTGKTTLLSTILHSIPASRANFSLVLNPMLTPAEFLELALLDFGIPEVPVSKAQRLMLLQQYLVEAHRQGKVSVLIVDEAHKLGPDLLEEIRLLTNFETAEGKLLQIVLAGQSELNALLARQDLRQLKQRIAVRLAIRPLTPAEVEHYLRHRWARAGASADLPFRAEAIEGITRWSQGIPRVVNAICDNALLLAYGAGVSSIGAEQIREAAQDLDLLNGGAPTAAASTARVEVAELRVPTPASALVAPGPIRVPPPKLPRQVKPSLLARWAGKLGLVAATNKI